MACRTLAHLIRHTQPARRQILRPSVHAARDNNLGCEFLAAFRALPLLQKGKECSGEPVRCKGVGAQRVVKCVWGDSPVALEVLLGPGLSAGLSDVLGAESAGGGLNLPSQILR